ncbi:formin-binding protein 4-like isoform X1 [Chenopodium quinoa]|uniref:formin-binding protein 4-like isoform X1 n=2 Tax=Chenopodium quinoa TaxID=63459 RepID=UPI000B770899|nr:formin-binding protein 4-like isoform X1 [Chenopodium quinoa]
MGKRKERRLAAKIGAGRRVKLDLFAEPAGDLGGTSAKDEDGKDVDSKHDPELPNSPSSSGQPPENPLSLLGQYSDDELDDGLNEEATNSDDEKQANDSACEPFEEGEIVDVEDHSSLTAHNLDVGKDSASASASPIAEADAVKSDMVSLDEKSHEVIENKDHVPEASDMKTAEGRSSIWKMVLHEESNRYYYWNTVTGETSWDIPESLAQDAAYPNELEILGTDMKVNAAPAAPASFGANLDNYSASQGVGYTSEISSLKAMYEQGSMVDQSLGQTGVDGSQFLGGFPVVGAVLYGASSLGNYSLSGHLDPSGGSLAASSYEGHDQSALTTEQGAVDLPSQLVKNGETLLERLKLLQRSGVDSVEHGWLSKYMLEIEIRLSDIRCLLPYGMSLIPFWMHMERQLNQLENAINTDIGNHNNKVSLLHVSTEGKEANLKVGGEAEVDASVRKLSPENFVEAVHNEDASVMAQKAIHDEALDDGILNVQQSSLQDPPGHQHSGIEGDREIDEPAVYGKATPNFEFQSNEDVDMDIDMEVEDQSPARKRIVDIGDQLTAHSGELVQTSVPMAGISPIPENEFFIPPPPQEEWIPPPPPDEPPESLYPPPPPSEPEPMPSMYSEQHSNTYIDPSGNYYGNTITDSTGTVFYEHADASQIAALVPPAYYATASNAQSTPVLNPVDSAVYYGVPNGALPVVHVPTTIGPSNLLEAPGHSNYDPPSSEQVGTVDAVARASSLSKQFVDPVAPDAEPDTAPTQLSLTSVSSAPATVSTKEFASVPSYSAAATCATVTGTSVAVPDASAAVSKVQPKAARMKKPKVSVTSSLRSNKKVSGLVDKWKAAKEELQEEEKEERKTPLEMLEKKRQREIEGWRAQQIASGEAKENANFQPLGGDWRERVKRKRAQKVAAVGTASDNADDGSKQPDINELSRDLSPGWQAYWDDSSQQVYYANSITSETTWTRPTR